MNKIAIRFIMFIAAAALTVAVPLLIFGSISISGRIGIGFMVLAEALVFLTPTAWRRKDFPIRLPLMLFVFPAYLAVTLALAICSPLIAWKPLLAVELVLAFPVLIAVCIAALAGPTDKETK